MKKISVILTTYYSEKSLQKVLDSVNNQQGKGTLFGIEWLVFDDCSTDLTREILKANRIDFHVSETNSGGPNRGRNHGLMRATGDYICIMDHDDVWHPDKIVTMLPILEKAPIVSSGYTLNDTKSGKIIERVNKCGQEMVWYPENETFLQLLAKSKTGQQPYIGSIMFKSELRHVHFEEEFGMVDYDWLLRLFHQRPSIEICKSLYTRYVFGKNLSLDKQYRMNDFSYSLKTLEGYSERYPGHTRKARKRIHGSLARYYYLTGNMGNARRLFIKSSLNWKTALYFFTTFIGSGWVRKHFNVFG